MAPERDATLPDWAGDDYVWVEDRGWRVPSGYSKCRQIRCPNPPVADLSRHSYARQADYWWAYCASHLYGRRIRDGKVMFPVAPGSPAAEQGWIA
jgi:hypothetical protein